MANRPKHYFFKQLTSCDKLYIHNNGSLKHFVGFLTAVILCYHKLAPQDKQHSTIINKDKKLLSFQSVGPPIPSGFSRPRIIEVSCTCH